MKIAVPDTQHMEGVFVLVHEPTRNAYVGTCKDLRHRQTIWERNFRFHTDPSFKFPLRGMPDKPGHEYTYYAFPGKTDEEIRVMLKAGNINVVNKATRKRRVYKKEVENV